MNNKISFKFPSLIKPKNTFSWPLSIDQHALQSSPSGGTDRRWPIPAGGADGRVHQILKNGALELYPVNFRYIRLFSMV